MCICIIKPSGKTIPEEHLRNSFVENSDGAGFATVRDGEVFIFKGFMDYESFLVAFETEVTAESVAIIHFRKGRLTNQSLCHPWKVNNMAMIHNGTLPLKVPLEFATDTEYFAHVLSEFLQASGLTISHPAVSKWLEVFTMLNPSSAHGTNSGNSLVFLDPSGSYHIIHEDGKHGNGEWNEDTECWYSNKTYKWKKYVPVKTQSFWESTPIWKDSYRKVDIYFCSRSKDFMFFDKHGTKRMASNKTQLHNQIDVCLINGEVEINAKKKFQPPPPPKPPTKIITTNTNGTGDGIDSDVSIYVSRYDRLVGPKGFAFAGMEDFVRIFFSHASSLYGFYTKSGHFLVSETIGRIRLKIRLQMSVGNVEGLGNLTEDEEELATPQRLPLPLNTTKSFRSGLYNGVQYGYETSTGFYMFKDDRNRDWKNKEFKGIRVLIDQAIREGAIKLTTKEEQIEELSS